MDYNIFRSPVLPFPTIPQYYDEYPNKDAIDI